MRKLQAALKLARIDLADGSVSEEEKRRCLAEAQRQHVTNTDYLFAHARLTVNREDQLRSRKQKLCW
jgi:hypothetical protein